MECVFCIYEFHYDKIENKYDNNWRLLFTDTDRLMCEIKAEGVYEDFSNNKGMFDFNNYSNKLSQNSIKSK